MSAHDRHAPLVRHEQVNIADDSPWKKLPMIFAVIGVLGLVAGFALGVGGKDPAKFWSSYLTAVMWGMSIALGGLFFVLVQHAARAGWPIVVRRIAENLMLDRSNALPFVKRWNVQRAALSAFAEKKVTEFDVRAQGIETPVGKLSGGNQQKVVLARELGRDLRLFVAAQPTRGLDVGSVEFVHERIVATRDAGTPVIVISTELDEVAALADRIMVMYRGRIVGIVPGVTPRAELGLMMACETPAGEGAAA